MNSTFQLSPDQASALAEKYGSPLVVLSLKQAEQNYRTLSDWLNRVKLHYAMKSNPAEPLLKTFADLGSGFDVATIGEIKTLLQLGVDPSRLIYANPTKPENWIAQAWKLGVTRFTYDSPAEVGKIAANAPGASVWLRVRIANPGALVNLNSKFGASQADALDLLQLAKSKGLDVAGLSFHVGSQTRDSGPYLNSLAVCRRIFNEAAEMGVPLRSLDIGGGFPIVELGYDIDQETMDSQIRDELEDLFPETELLAEPGRALCGTTANLITSVIGKQVRDGQDWYILDDGIYGTFSGILFDHWDFELLSAKTGPLYLSTFAGPSCDSLDVLFRDRSTPELEVGDRLVVPACGAYTSASATTFNGFSLTPIVIWEEVKESL
ncbi:MULTISPECIES: type III PLP-dependent enzyme [Jonquetella]|uniref:Diaminopimelate decarboxylase n=1 Tax=Jonquetella anthropi DSM 22815 TaxID=885272 RepID=H0ULY1_9BACT|nr:MULTISPECIES: type III PLP-dependent enzyme [Jonquetella]EHM12523.1 diaminopimelate decarboxylase [Jonquetella anthropi DSM 22815]ERL24846.1 putative lysine/ornithine decarboxylase [Jonquetella sp. BV3C21]